MESFSLPHMSVFPLVSIVMPIRNEAQHIERTLRALSEQDYPASLVEVLVIDGMSTDDTRSRITAVSASCPGLNVRVLDNPRRTAAAAMNIGISHAAGEILVRVDGHAEVAPDYVRKCVEHIHRDGVDGVGGAVESIGETPVGRVIAVAMSSRFGNGNAAFRLPSRKNMLVDTIPFPAYTRDIVRRAGPFDEDLARDQDDEYNYRIRGLGGKLLLAADVHSRYYVRSSLGQLWQQYYQYGCYKIRVLQRHPLQMQVRQFAPPLLVLGLLASALLAAFSRLPLRSSSFFLRVSVITPLLYLITDLLAAAATAARRGWKYVPLLPIVFGILHISYGLGFLAGCVKFAGRWTHRAGTAQTWSVAEPFHQAEHAAHRLEESPVE